MKHLGLLTVFSIALAIASPLRAQVIHESPIIWIESKEDPKIKTMVFLTENLGYKEKDIPDNTFVVTYSLFCSFGPDEFGPSGHSMRVITGIGSKDEPITGTMSVKYNEMANVSNPGLVRTFPHSGKYTHSGQALGGHQGYVFFQDEVYVILNSAAIAPQLFEEIKITIKGAAWERSFTYHPNSKPKAVEAMHKYCATKNR